MTYLMQYDFVILAEVYRAVDLKSPVYALFENLYDQLSFNQVFRSKSPCIFCIYRDYFCWFLCVL
jgi:hypothetical protein